MKNYADIEMMEDMANCKTDRKSPDDDKSNGSFNQCISIMIFKNRCLKKYKYKYRKLHNKVC